MTQNEALQKYGAIENNIWPDEAKHMAILRFPNLGLPWINSITGQKCDHIYMNKDMFQPFITAMENLQLAGLVDDLKTMDGCFEIRDIRGIPGQLSAHSYGMAVDINAKENPLGSPSAFDPAFVKCFTDAGFTWGGTFSRIDGMHFSLTGF